MKAQYSTELIPENGSKASAVIEAILDLDRANMASLLTASGQSFPEAKRRAGLTGDSTTVVLLRYSGELVGYADFTRSWADPRDLYVGSMQINKDHHGTTAIAVLIGACVGHLRNQEFRQIVAHVQANNARAVRFCERLGFRINRDSGGPNLEITADRSLLDRTKLRSVESWVKARSS